MRYFVVLICGFILAPLATADGLRPGERAMLDRIRQRESAERYQKQDSRDFDRRHTLTFSDRKRIRELEMEKRQLNDQLRRGGSWSQNLSLERQIHDIDRQIEQIRSPKY